MPDIGHFFSGDLQLGANGDLLVADSVLESQQRVLRRLLTNPTDYIWQPGYGAGLPRQIGMPIRENEIDSLIKSQMYLEPSVVQSPAPQIVTSSIPNGLDVQIQYVEVDSSQPTALSFSVTP
ncbi:phage tail protein [Limnoglobus roseus]|uniref:Phage tail protein n=1 Tax=Limnoglobus roseus TaxID=2598579 RepID=A0A5C1APB7_9BACT|nr:phage tail protein [Limnoglobus roseus]QEL18708.1 hypothetical protein PX52LOC_05744 [Limnoglobus roseus]